MLLAVCFLAMCAVLGQTSGVRSTGDKLWTWSATLVLVIAGIVTPAFVIGRGERRSPPTTLPQSIAYAVASTYAALAVFTILLAGAAFVAGVWHN